MKHLLNNLSEEEKNTIREQHAGGMKVMTENFLKLINSKLGDVKPLINENVPGQFLKKFFTNNSDDIIKNLSDDAVKEMDDLLGKVLNPKNMSGGMVLSKSGAKVKKETIEDLISLSSSGKINIDDYINKLPRELADGTIFRDTIQNIVKKIKLHPYKSGSKFSNEYLKQHANKIDFSKIKNANSIDELNSLISNALSTSNYNYISNGGFERFGIPKFRDFLKNSQSMEELRLVDPKKGTWSFSLK
jgi:hypothetical protein